MPDQIQHIEKWDSHAGRKILTQLARGEIQAAATFQRLGLKRWEQSWLRRALRRNFSTQRRTAPIPWRIIRSLARELDTQRETLAKRRTSLSPDQRRFHGNKTHLRLLEQALASPQNDNEWNDWRKRHPHIKPDLRGANLERLDLSYLRLDSVLLTAANLTDCNLVGAHLSEADLRKATLFNTNLREARLQDSHLEGAWLHGANLTLGDLRRTHLREALLSSCTLNQARLQGADLRGAYIWGCSYSGIALDGSTRQKGIRLGLSDFDWINSVIEAKPGSAFARPEVSVEIDDLRVADFMSQISEYPERVAGMINAASSKLVLLLGRFRGKQRMVLDDLSSNLSQMGFVPMVFDFTPPENRDVIETVAILAGLSRFVIADLTNPHSVPLETQLVVPTLAVPFIPIIRKGEPAFSMFSALKHKYPWVRPLVKYRTNADLIRRLRRNIVPRAIRLAEQLRKQKHIGQRAG